MPRPPQRARDVGGHMRAARVQERARDAVALQPVEQRRRIAARRDGAKPCRRASAAVASPTA